MSDRRSYPEFHSCIRKRRYESERTAAAATVLCFKKEEHKDMNVYRCRFCNGWHVGHKVPAWKLRRLGYKV